MTLDPQQRFHNLKQRAVIYQCIRDYFTRNQYLEVTTPQLCHNCIPEAHIDPIMADKKLLQASPEMCMKQLLSQGFEKIFQIARCFRKNERSVLHLPEFTLLEWYTKDHTYQDLMTQCTELIQNIAEQILNSSVLTYQGRTINLAPPWKKLRVDEAFKTLSDTSLAKALKTDRFDEIISFQIEPCLKEMDTPVFLYDYPKSQASLSKKLPENPEFAQRFELYIAGIEIANGFTELNDPQEQRRRFIHENKIRVQLGKPAIDLPEQFLKSLENMPDAAGIAMGLERLVMIFTDAASIDEVVTFTPEVV